MYIFVYIYICRLPYQVGVEVVGVKMEGEEEARLENLVHRGSWAEELG